MLQYWQVGGIKLKNISTVVYVINFWRKKTWNAVFNRSANFKRNCLNTFANLQREPFSKSFKYNHTHLNLCFTLVLQAMTKFQGLIYAWHFILLPWTRQTVIVSDALVLLFCEMTFSRIAVCSVRWTKYSLDIVLLKHLTASLIFQIQIKDILLALIRWNLWKNFESYSLNSHILFPNRSYQDTHTWNTSHEWGQLKKYI